MTKAKAALQSEYSLACKFRYPLRLSLGLYANGRTVQTTFLEDYNTVLQGVQCVVLTHCHVLAGVVLGAALANDDVAGNALLTTKNLNT